MIKINIHETKIISYLRCTFPTFKHKLTEFNGSIEYLKNSMQTLNRNLRISDDDAECI